MRAVHFVFVMNTQGYEPPEQVVRQYVNAPTRKDNFDPWAFDMYVETVDYLLDAGILQAHGSRIILSTAGIAVFTAALAEEKASSHGTLEVVGRLNDPYTYSELLTRVNDVQEAMIVDPYLPPEDLRALLRLDNIRSVLTLDKGAAGLQRQDRRKKLGIALGARPEVELRFAPADARELHDRLVLPAKRGEALFLGTSLGGTQVTVITRLGVETTEVLRAHYTDLWEAGERLDPIGRDGIEDAQDENMS